MNEQHFAILFKKYLEKTASGEERALFFKMLAQPGIDIWINKYAKLHETELLKDKPLNVLSEEHADTILANIFQKVQMMEGSQEVSLEKAPDIKADKKDTQGYEDEYASFSNKDTKADHASDIIADQGTLPMDLQQDANDDGVLYDAQAEEVNDRKGRLRWPLYVAAAVAILCLGVYYY